MQDLNYEMLQDYVNLFAENVKTNNQIPIKKVLKKVYFNKKEVLYKLLGNSYTITKPFAYHKSQHEVIKSINEYVVKSEFYAQYMSWANNYVEERYADKRGEEYIDTWIGLHCIIDGKHLITNRINKNIARDISRIYLPTGKEFNVTANMKIMHFFNKIVNSFDCFNKNDFEEFRIKLSTYSNDIEVKGNLTLSIHPIDYWTMSDNDNNWSTCMSWENNGEYRSGTVEMMNSPSVVVAYVESASPYQPRNFNYQISNKKWRELFIVDKAIITNIKAYPYINLDISKQIIDWIKELAEKNLGWTYNEEVKKFDAYNPSIFGHGINFATNFMYNDFCADTDHVAYLSDDETVVEELGKDEEYTINYSGPRQCLMCGKVTHVNFDVDNYPTTEDFLDDTELFCFDCNDSVYCDCCDERVTNYVTTPSGQHLCEDCAKFCNVCENYTVGIKYSIKGDVLKAFFDENKDILAEIADQNLYGAEEYYDMLQPDRYYTYTVCDDCYDRLMEFEKEYRKNE